MKKTPNGEFNNIEYFTNTPIDENKIEKTETKIEPKQPPKDINELEEKLKEFDYKYHCNLCPYFCFYKLYYSKTEKKFTFQFIVKIILFIKNYYH